MKQAIRKQREREGHLANIANEAMGAMRVVQSFRRERYEVKRFGGANSSAQRSAMKAARFEAKMRWAIDLSTALVTATVFALATQRIIAQSLTPGDLIVFITYLTIYGRPIRQISKLTEGVARAAAAGERVLQILETRAEIVERADAVAVSRLQGDIEFDDVSFSYRGTARVLKHVNLKITAGERVALVGPNGAGKSSIVSLLPRFYDPSEGRVRIDGHDVRTFTLASLRKNITLLSQEPVLFATTVAENIAYGKPNAPLEDIERAATKAGVHDAILQLEHGYDTPVGERGALLSGGQRQAVAIARAMIRNAPIIILDELTTGLDPGSARLVSRALERLVRGRTVILITHDIENLGGMQRVIRLERGRVIDDARIDGAVDADRVAAFPRGASG